MVADWILDLITWGVHASPGMLMKGGHETHIRWDGDSPHRHTSSTTSEDDSTQAKIRRTGWR